MKLLSVVVPCFNEQESISAFYGEINRIAETMKNEVKFEIIFVDDGSTDGTLEIIRNLSKNNKNVKYISFSRNFGKESAMFAGLEKSKGDYVAIMDVDLQDPPELIPSMYALIVTENYDCIATRRNTRKGEPLIRSFFAKCFYAIINSTSNLKLVHGARDFRLMTRQMTDSILQMKEYHRFLKGIFNWVGYKTKWLEYENVKRVSGRTKWSFWKLFKYSLEAIFAFSASPLIFASIVGIIMFIVAVIMIIVIIVKTLLWGDPVAGYPSLICVILFIGGIQLYCIGILGQYLSKTYMETKRRPLFIIKEENK